MRGGGLYACGVAFWLFPLTLKKPIEAWLFEGESSAAPDDTNDDEHNIEK